MNQLIESRRIRVSNLEEKPMSQNLNSYIPTSPKFPLFPSPSLKSDGRKTILTFSDGQMESESQSSGAHQGENTPEGRREGDRPLKSSLSGGSKADETGRERLKRHRVEVAGQVWIPDIWGQESFLQDWIDCSGFDSVPKEILSARAALVEEGRRARSGRLSVENSC